MKKKVLGIFMSLLLIITFSSCKKSSRGIGSKNAGAENIKILSEQIGYDKVVLTFYKNVEGKKVYLVGRELNVILGNKEFLMKTNNDGMITVIIPKEQQTLLNEVEIEYKGKIYKIPYKKRKILRDYKIMFAVGSYKRIDFKITERRYEQKNGVKTLIEEKPYEGKAEFKIADLPRIIKYTGDGVIKLKLNDDQMRNFVENPVFEISLNNTDKVVEKVDIKPPSGKVEMINPNIANTSFECELFNGTFSNKKVLIRAGYVRYEDKWFISKIFSKAYFKEVIYELEPGELKKVLIHYDEPLLGTRKLKYIYKIVNTRDE